MVELPLSELQELCVCIWQIKEQQSIEYFEIHSSTALQSEIEKVAKCDSPWPITFITARPGGSETALGMLCGHYRLGGYLPPLNGNTHVHDQWPFVRTQTEQEQPLQTIPKEGIDVIGNIFFPCSASSGYSSSA